MSIEIDASKSQVSPEKAIQAYWCYLELRTSLFHFSKLPESLAPEERKKLKVEVLKQERINEIVRHSGEYSMMVIPEVEIENALNEIYAQFEKESDADKQLVNVGLDRATLKDVVARDLRVAAVLNYIGEQNSEVNDTDAELFYRMHQDKFRLNERRRASHILITVNSAYKENKRQHARARIEVIYDKLISDSSQFEKLAKTNSECPTALEGGQLGVVEQGQLFPELGQALFALDEGHISAIVETELGFHVIRCDDVIHSQLLPFSEVREKIKNTLLKRNQRSAQKNWLKERSNITPVP